MGQIGDRVASPLTLLEETTIAVRRLLDGEMVSVAGRYVQLDNVKLEYPPQQVPKVLAGVTGPKSLLLAGRVANGTVLPEGYGPTEIAKARELTNQGRQQADRADPHHLTVFAGFYAGPMTGISGDNPDASVGFDWGAVSEDTAEVTAKLQTLIDAGADSVVLLPFGQDVTTQLQLAAAEIVPKLVRA
jgi:alkanesulfonate monooxygenase SsuD/methylene tetrahydromethanopterin reductase-like flavin-dependent oxidoreductase (luciferase family)